jgi:hypothetical protein
MCQRSGKGMTFKRVKAAFDTCAGMKKQESIDKVKREAAVDEQSSCPCIEKAKIKNLAAYLT